MAFTFVQNRIVDTIKFVNGGSILHSGFYIIIPNVISTLTLHTIKECKDSVLKSLYCAANISTMMLHNPITD